MDFYVTMLLYFALPINVIGIAIGVSRWASARNADRVSGTVINIIPKYRGADYTVKINDDGTKVIHTFYKRTFWSSYGMGSLFHFYKIQTSTGIKYKAVLGYYTWTWALLFAPWVAMFGSLMGID